MKEDKFVTSNLNFVAAMVALGSQVTDADKTDSRKVFFTLENPPHLVWEFVNGYPQEIFSGTFDRLFVLFNSRSLMLHPGSFDSLRNMKSIIYS